MESTPYEICFWIKDDNTDNIPVAVFDKIKQAVLKFDGEAVTERLPEKRLLAYPIAKQRTAYWAELAFNLAPDKLASFKEELKYEDKILRKVVLLRQEKKSFKPRVMAEQRETAPRPKPITSPEQAKEIEEQLDTKLKEILEV